MLSSLLVLFGDSIFGNYSVFRVFNNYKVIGDFGTKPLTDDIGKFFRNFSFSQLDVENFKKYGFGGVSKLADLFFTTRDVDADGRPSIKSVVDYFTGGKTVADFNPTLVTQLKSLTDTLTPI